MVRLDAFDDLRGLTSRFNPSCGLLELPAIRGQVRATDLEESLDRDADEMFREDHALVLASAQGEVLLSRGRYFAARSLTSPFRSAVAVAFVPSTYARTLRETPLRMLGNSRAYASSIPLAAISPTSKKVSARRRSSVDRNSLRKRGTWACSLPIARTRRSTGAYFLRR